MPPLVELPVLPPPVDELWHTLLDLSDRLDVPWALIGGQMVLLHAVENGQVPPQVSQDGDVIADVRAVPGALTRVVTDLEAMGFALQGISADGLAHRYIRSAEPRPDVLAPEGLGERADLTGPPCWPPSSARRQQRRCRARIVTTATLHCCARSWTTRSTWSAR